MTTPLGFATQFAATVIAAEFTSGVIHWIEDAYIREDTPYVGKIVGRPNMIHHHFPRYMRLRKDISVKWVKEEMVREGSY